MPYRLLTMAVVATGSLALSGCTNPSRENIHVTLTNDTSQNDVHRYDFMVDEDTSVHGTFTIIGTNAAAIDVRYGPHNTSLHASANEIYCTKGVLRGFTQVNGLIAPLVANVGDWQLRKDHGSAFRIANSRACNADKFVSNKSLVAAATLAAMFKNKYAE